MVKKVKSGNIRKENPRLYIRLPTNIRYHGNIGEVDPEFC